MTGWGLVLMNIAYVVGTYPLLTTTFIDREIEELAAQGVPVRLVSLRRPGGPLSPSQTLAADAVEYVLPIGLFQVLSAVVRWLVRRPATLAAGALNLLTRPHANLAARLKTLAHIGEGVVVASILARGDRPDHIHAHFIDRAAVVADVAARLLGVRFSVTAHANDIYVDPVLLPEKLARARFVATCTEYNRRHLAGIAPNGADIVTIHHGIDIHRFQPGATPGSGSTLRLLAVGQLKEKKGFSYLLEACAILRRRGVRFECKIVGEGPLRAALEELRHRLDLEDLVAFTGALPHDEVVTRFREADLFVLPCVIGEDGDRDGIPNVVLEAMAMGLPVVSTRHSGIPEAVSDGESGILVAPADAAGLAEAIGSLAGQQGRLVQMGTAGKRIVNERFDLKTNVELLARRLAVR